MSRRILGLWFILIGVGVAAVSQTLLSRDTAVLEDGLEAIATVTATQERRTSRTDEGLGRWYETEYVARYRFVTDSGTPVSGAVATLTEAEFARLSEGDTFPVLYATDPPHSSFPAPGTFGTIGAMTSEGGNLFFLVAGGGVALLGGAILFGWIRPPRP